MIFAQLATTVREPFTNLGAWISANQPRILSALALIVVGLLLAFVLRALAVRLVRAVERMVPRHAFRTWRSSDGTQRHVPDVIGPIVFWAVIVFFGAAAADALGLGVLGTAIAGLGLYVPRVLAAVVVVAVGIALGNLARDAVIAAASAAGAPFAPAAGQIVRVAILFAAALIAIGQLGVDISLLTAIVSVSLAAVLGGFALAFGLGARTAISNIIGSHYLRQTYEVGQTVRFGDVEGTIAAITATAVVVRVTDGQVSIPARLFNESASTLVTAAAPR